MQGDPDEAERLRSEARRCDKRAEEEAEDNPSFAAYMERRSSHLRRLARDEEDYRDIQN